MADTSTGVNSSEVLDDFFAKKDRNKKGKKKYKTCDDSTGDSESSGKRTKDNKLGGILHDADDEWKAVEEPSEVDYSNLKVASMQISDQDRLGGSGDEGSGSESKLPKNVWIKDAVTDSVEATEPVPSSEEAVPTPKTDAKPETPSNPTSTPPPPRCYVPPGLRNRPAGGATDSGPSFPQRRKKGPPKIESTDDFPTLG